MLAVAAIALVWSLGWLNPLLVHLPIVNRFRWPFKLMLMVSFFLVVVGALGLDATHLASRGRRWLAPGLALFQAAALGALLRLDGPRGFMEHLDPLPLDARLASGLSEGRVLSVGYSAWERIGGMHTAPSLGFNYATYFRVFQFAGYEPLRLAINAEATFGLDHVAAFQLEAAELEVERFRPWGVRWYLLDPKAAPRYEPTLIAQGLKLARREPHRFVYEDPRAPPLAAAVGGLCHAPFDGADDGSVNELRISVDCEAPDTLAIAFLGNPQLEVEREGQTIRHELDPLGRILVPVPQGRSRLVVRYAERWARAGVIGSLLGLCLLAIAVAASRRRWRLRW
jgi:hypothetical protein